MAFPLSRREAVAAIAGAAVARAEKLSRFRLGITTDEIDDDLATACGFIRRFGLEYAEIRNLWGKYNTAQPIEMAHKARAILDDMRIKLAILDTGFFKVPLPPESPEGNRKIDEQFAVLEAAKERAKILGTDKIRIFAFTYKGQKTPNAEPRIAELLKEASRRARGFRLAIENVGESYMWSGADAARILKLVPESNICLTWDPNNAAATGEQSFPDGYKLLDPARIVHVHLRDYRRLPNGKVEWALVGQGEFDHVSQLRALLKAGYKETMSLETHAKIPEGKAAASEASIKGLLERLKQV
ncbi:MAG: sugar phosphate isomerase/epimerase family protein [Bryobacteraceae bacterium]